MGYNPEECKKAPRNQKMKNIFNKGRFINIYRKILYEMFLEQEVGSARRDFFT
jgi:hypothetical protein